MTLPHNLDEIESDTLDPRDWEEFRQLAHAALDEAVDYLRDVRERPVWRPMTDTQKDTLCEPIPLSPQGLRQAYKDLQQIVLPHPTGNIHPRFWGWVHGTGLASGLISEIMAAAMNSNCGGRDHAALYVERQVIEWCRQIVRFPAGCTGILVSGTSMGNIIALTVARNARARSNIRKGGILGEGQNLITYASSEAHSSVVKALELIGLGGESLHSISVDKNFAINIDELLRAIRQDRRSGNVPFCVVGCAGTVNTGSLDNLPLLAEVCKSEHLWFHVDGAFGALCAISEPLQESIKGIELCDSLAFDFHKWMYIQYDAGCVLVRDGALHRAAFAGRPEYLRHADRGLAGGGEWFADFGPELSRSFRAIKIWFALKTYGTKNFARMIEKNCRQAAYLAELVTLSPLLELLATPILNIVCFRCRPAIYTEMQLDLLNVNVVAALQETGIAAPSITKVRGKVAIRIAITNHRSRNEDFQLLVSSTIAIAERLITVRPE